MMRRREIDSVIAALAEVPWLTRLGAPIDPDEAPLSFRFEHDPWTGTSDPWSSPLDREEAATATRLRSFNDWKGPEDEASVALSDDVNLTYTHVIRESGWLRRRKREAIYTRARDFVIELAAKRVAYDPERDPWYAPNAAVLTAGSVAGLMVVYRLIGEWPDTPVERLWQWLRCGHWPAAYDDEEFPVVY